MLRLVTVCRPAKVFNFYSEHPDVCSAIIIIIMIIIIIIIIAIIIIIIIIIIINCPSLMSLRQNGFRNLAKLAFSVRVKDRKAPSDPSWPRFCCLRCFLQKNLPKKVFFWKLSYFRLLTKKRK